MSPSGTQSMSGAGQGVGISTTVSGYAETRPCRCQRMTIDAEQFMTYAKMMRTDRWQHGGLIQFP